MVSICMNVFMIYNEGTLILSGHEHSKSGLEQRKSRSIPRHTVGNGPTHYAAPANPLPRGRPHARRQTGLVHARSARAAISRSEPGRIALWPALVMSVRWVRVLPQITRIRGSYRW